MKKMALNGNYIFGCWRSLCEGEVARGELIEVLPEYETVKLDFYLTNKIKPSPAEIKLIEFLEKCMSRSLNKIE